MDQHLQRSRNSADPVRALRQRAIRASAPATREAPHSAVVSRLGWSKSPATPRIVENVAVTEGPSGASKPGHGLLGHARTALMLGGMVLFAVVGLPRLFEMGRRMNALPGGAGESGARLQPDATARAQPAPQSTDKNIAFARGDDAEMVAARDKARAGLDTFWAMLAAPGPGISNLSLKVALPTRGGSLEHIWVGDIVRRGDEISGRLNNTPRDLAGLKMGSAVTFTHDQIDDWTFNRNGKMVGNESARPLIARMPPAEAAKYRAMFETP